MRPVSESGPAPLTLRGRTFDAARPAGMAIINRTNDSFYAPARYADLDGALARLDQVVEEGADIVDVGAVRAGQEGEHVSAETEIERLVRRHNDSGKDPAYAREWVARVDQPNADLVEAAAAVPDAADEVLDLSAWSGRLPMSA